jgi:hypothetical protein
MKIRPVGAQLFHASGRTDTTKLIVAFRNFAKASKTQIEEDNVQTTVRPLTMKYRGADKSLARPGRNQATATEDFEFHISYLLS